VTANIRAMHLGELYQHPYDIGLYHNLNEILGTDMAAWWLPPCAPTEGGTVFPTVWDEQALGLNHGPFPALL
jgi:hypothetical protein